MQELRLILALIVVLLTGWGIYKKIQCQHRPSLRRAFLEPHRHLFRRP